MEPLEPPDSHFVSAAEGWLGLDNWQEAAEELKNVSPDLVSHPDVLEVRYEIWAKAGQWELAAETASTWIRKAPEERGAWIKQAYEDIPARFPRIELVNWFSRNKTKQGETDWRFNSSKDAQSAFSAAVNSPLYQGEIKLQH